MFLAAVVTLLVLAACSSGGGGGGGDAASPAVTTPPDHASAADLQWDEGDEVAITLNGRSASASKASVKVDGATITIAAAGTYRLSGKLDDGQVVVDSAGDGIVRLVLDGVDITSSTTAAIAVMKADEAVVMLADGSTNRLVDAATYVFPAGTDEPNAALYSAAGLTLGGTGSLAVKGNFNDAVASQDGLVVTGGNLTLDAVDDGIRGKDYLVVEGGSLTVTAGGDGLKADNVEEAGKGYLTVKAGTVKVVVAGDGLSAATDLVVADGTIDVTAGGGSTKTVAATASAKGLKGTGSVTVEKGTLKLNTADDAIHSNAKVVVNGGYFAITTGDDGIHADASLAVNGGLVNIAQSYEGIESRALTIAGGEVRIVSRDDGVNGSGGRDASGVAARADTFAAGAPTLTISGGTLLVDANGDGIDINGSITMTGGTALVNGPTARGNGAVDYDGTFTITGGLLVGAGSSGMVQAPTGTSSQPSLLSTFAAQAAGTPVHIQSTDGTAVLTFVPTKSFQAIVLSSGDLSRDATYQVSVGGTASGNATFGLYPASGYSGGSVIATTNTAAAAAAARTTGGPART